MKEALILAAGKGTRMGSLTDNTPKPLIKVNGKPFLDYTLEHLEAAGYDKTYIVVGYLKEKIQAHIDSKNYSMKVELIDQGEALGTGHAVQVAEKYIKGNFVIINGDIMFAKKDLEAINLEDDFNYIYSIEHAEPQHFGVLKTDGEMLIEIQEKPANPPTNLINAGLYKFTQEIFSELNKIEKSERGEYEITTAIDALTKQGKFKYGVLKGHWLHLGKPEDIAQIEAELNKSN